MTGTPSGVWYCRTHDAAVDVPPTHDDDKCPGFGYVNYAAPLLAVARCDWVELVVPPKEETP